ncbi:MAG: hypothetical protein P1P88_26495, partial [Bacteroidales bacterium]|nr:hypothetical protein [Bacteroidales bacterium]
MLPFLEQVFIEFFLILFVHKSSVIRHITLHEVAQNYIPPSNCRWVYHFGSCFLSFPSISIINLKVL